MQWSDTTRFIGFDAIYGAGHIVRLDELSWTLTIGTADDNVVLFNYHKLFIGRFVVLPVVLSVSEMK